MIELIFVIVILGILAAVAIPRLTATRDDAEAAALITAISQATTEMSSLYVAKGETVNMNDIKAWDNTKLQSCVDIAYYNGTNKVTAAGETATSVKVTSKDAETSLCKALYAIPTFKDKYKDKDIKIGGTGIYE